MDRPDDTTCTLNCRVPRTLWRRVKLQTTLRDVTLKVFIRAAIEERMGRERKVHHGH